MGSAAVSSKSSHSKRPVKPAKERVLIEFPAAALRRAEEAARAEGVSRSEFIRTAVEAAAGGDRRGGIRARTGRGVHREQPAQSGTPQRV